MRSPNCDRGVIPFVRMQMNDPDTWFRRLHFGLKMMGENFPIVECYCCHGSGYHMYHVCITCKGACLIYARTANVVPASVTNQVWEAGAAFEIED